MARLLLVPILLASLLSVILASGALKVFSRGQHVRSDRDHALAADIEHQRQMAECYRIGCPGTNVSPVIGCAWRLAILEETHAADDSRKADSDCGNLDEKEQHTASIAKDSLLHRLHPEPVKIH